MRSAWAFVALGTVLVACIAAAHATLPPGAYGDLSREDAVRYIAWLGAAAAAYGVGVLLVRRGAGAGAVPVILAAGLVARLLTLAAPPILSTDIYRYVWDGRVQAAGINPYRFIPADPALAALRDPAPHTASTIFGNINRAETAPTIYPPAAQAVFAAVGLVAPSIWTMKAVMLGFDLMAGLCLFGLLRAAGRPPALLLAWAWHPLLITEFAGSGHIDAMAAAFSALALLLAAHRRTTWAATALAVAVLSKLLPAALFPALWRRWDWRSPLIVAGVIAAGYAAYASVGWRVFGYLGGYAQEESLQDGGGFLLLRLLLALAGPLPGWAGKAYAVAGLSVLGGLALWVVRQPLPTALAARADVIARGALVLAAALIAVMSPHYPWYVAMLVVPAAMVGSAAALWPTVAAPLLYLDFELSNVLWPAIVFLPAIPLLFVDLRFLRPARSALLAERGS